MRDVSPALIVGCGSALICGILLLLIGVSALRFTARFGFIIPVATAVFSFFTKRRDQTEAEEHMEQQINRPRQPSLDIRARPQTVDFDSAVEHYRQQQNVPNQTSASAQSAQTAQPTQPLSAQNATRPLVPRSPDLDSPAMQPGQPQQPRQPGQPLQPPALPPNTPGTAGPTTGAPTLGDDDLDRYSLRSRFPQNRPVYGDRYTRQRADENEDFVAGLLGSEEEFQDDDEGGLF